MFDLLVKKKKDVKFNVSFLVVKEWCVYGGRRLDDFDVVELIVFDWEVLLVDKFWFSKGVIVDNNRLKVFLFCMKSDIFSMI